MHAQWEAHLLPVDTINSSIYWKKSELQRPECKISYISDGTKKITVLIVSLFWSEILLKDLLDFYLRNIKKMKLQHFKKTRF